MFTHYTSSPLSRQPCGRLSPPPLRILPLPGACLLWLHRQFITCNLGGDVLRSYRRQVKLRLVQPRERCAQKLQTPGEALIGATRGEMCSEGTDARWSSGWCRLAVAPAVRRLSLCGPETHTCFCYRTACLVSRHIIFQSPQRTETKAVYTADYVTGYFIIMMLKHTVIVSTEETVGGF